MKKINILILVCFLGIAGSSYLNAGEKAPQKVIDIANSELEALGSDPVIVKAVKAENAKGKSLDEIKAMDEKWKAHAGIADYMKAMMESGLGKHLREIQNSESYYAEIFVMDNLGSNVAMTDKTSDYWQGDEGKFWNSYNGGIGAVFVDEVEEDGGKMISQVSVPVMN